MSDEVIKRPVGRPPLNPIRAPQRAPQRRRIFTPGNRFEYDESKTPPGMVYQWVRATLAGQEDPENLILAEQNGWQCVPAGRHPELAGQRAAPESEIRRGGLVLMEQPKEWAQEAKEMDEFAARHAVESQISRLGLQARREGVKQPFRRTQEAIAGEEVE